MKSSKLCGFDVKSPRLAFREFSPPRYGLLTHLNERGERRRHWQRVRKLSLWRANLLRCRFAGFPFEAHIPLGNCTHTTRLCSYTLDRNIVRRSASGMQAHIYVSEIFLKLRFLAHLEQKS